ncbi:hypothetical protein ABMA27_016932 [Loxostege sticticalis]|uniref:Apple domain-containing protein n=1 Tax=Loxostege sticticalis TaxID=481309 RepID=A0ABR3GZE8_LOXSC
MRVGVLLLFLNVHLALGSRVILVENAPTCFRRVLAGRRALRSFVRKVVACERLEDCRRECADERRFHCESFNYRLDPSFRGKGLCELMTKPIEAFDISRDFVEDKDYDFYEVDRNSLEPHCPESLGGPGLLHSGFLSSKPNRLPNYQVQNQWDRTDQWQDSRYHRDYDRFYEEKRRYGGGRRRYPDYIPYQIGVGRSSEADIENWGTYGGVYGGNDNYYKDRNDYYNSVNHWRIPNNSRTYGVKPGYNSDFDYYSLGKERSWESQRYGSWKRGRWNTSGANGLDYGESNYYKPHKPHHYAEDRDDDGGGKDCSSRRRPGMSLGSGAIRRSLLARNVVECEAACFEEREFKCVSYSYRYSSSRGTDNCFLSERPYRGLELSADSGSDVYAMPQDQGCSTISHRPWVESECFWHVRSEAAVSGSAVRSALTVTGLGACEAECIRAHAFFCRGFSFRFDSPTTGDDLPNCILTSSPPTSLSGDNARRSHGHELYARGNYGRGCEPALYDDAPRDQHEDGECYLQYDNAAKLVGAAVRGQARVRDEQACGAACTEAPFRCLSFSFNNHAPQGVDNCLLSEIRLFDLQRGVDYQHSVDDWLFAFDLFNGQCWRKVHGKHAYEEPSSELPRPLIPGESGPSGSGYPSAASEPYLPASGPPSGPGYKPGYPASSPSGPDYKPGYPASAPSGPSYKPSYPASPGYHEPSGPEPSGPGYKPGYPPSEPSAPGYLPKPGYQPPFRPSEPSGPSYSKPDYRPDPSGPSYSKPDYRPDAGPSYLPGPRPGYGSEPSGPSYLPRPKPEYRPDPIGPSYSPGFKPAYRPPEPHGYPDSGFKPGYPPPRPEPGYRPGEGRPRPYPERPSGPSRPTVPQAPSHGGHREEQEPISVSWRHYTVSGFPCRAGTTCAQNKVAGHWACEPEGGEVGSWDYCCAPTHRCGYSEGFPKPWCYVGTMEDQWRPCSEKYYPYHQHNIPHPSQGGHRDDQRRPLRPQQDRPSFQDGDRPHLGPYATEAERKYWDDLYKNGPQAYYDKYGNPLPGYTKVPTASRPYIKYRHNYQGHGSGMWVPVAGQDPAHAGAGLGAPRYWPVAYLHKGPPPNMTYFVYNETHTTTTTEAYTRTPIEPPRENPPQDFNRGTEKPRDRDVVEARNHRDEKTRNITDRDIFQVDLNQFTTTTTTTSTTTTSKPEVKLADSLVEEKEIQQNKSEVEMIKPENVKEEKESENIKGIDDKLEDFTSPIEVLDIEDAAKGDKISDLKTLEAEERQIEAIGRLLASRRGSKLVLEKRSQKDLETKSIAVDKDLVDFNFGNRFPTTERRGIIQKVTKDEIERERNADKSLEVSETTFVRPPRVLSTTENIRKAIVNGKVFYDATIREQRDIFSNATRKAKGLRQLEDARGPSVIMNSNFGKKKVIKARNVNPVRRVRRVYRKRYNPEEVRRRLIERERSMKMDNDTSRKL